MNRLAPGILCAAVIAALLLVVVIQHGAADKLRVENATLRSEIFELKAELNLLSNSHSASKRTFIPRLPAPAMQPNIPSESSLEISASTNLIFQLLQGSNAPKLTLEQVEPFLKANHRSGISLVVASRASGDPALLQEAMEKHPNDPQVAFAAVFKPESTPEDRRKWLDQFQQSAPDNSLANYLSAYDRFKSGNTDQAVQELTAAAGKQPFADYSMDFIMAAEEAYRTAGFSVAEAKTLADSQLLLQQLSQLKDLNRNMIDLAASYRQTGDNASAQTLLQMGVNLGERLQTQSAQPLISELVGIAVETVALKSMDANAPLTDRNQTVQDRLYQLTQERNDIKGLRTDYVNFREQMTDQDWISYSERRRLFGEHAAFQWLASKYGQN